MIQRAVLLLLIPLCAGAWGDTVTVLSGLDTREQVDQFVSRVQYSMAEPVTSPRRQGTGAMRLRFFGHPSLKGTPRVQALARRQGLVYSNWAPYDRLVLDLHSGSDAHVPLVLIIEAGEQELAVPVTLEKPGWKRVTVTVQQLRDAGLDVGAVTGLGLMPASPNEQRPSRVVMDFVRLVGSNAKAIREAKAIEDKRNAMRPPWHPRRTSIAAGVVKPEPIGKTVRRSVKAPVVADTEVLVVGGGLAGVAAAVTAARMGADVLLVERAGSLGGMATTGFVPPAFNRTVAEGVVAEFCDRLQSVGGAEQNRNPEIMKYVLLSMLRDSGAKVMLYTLAVDAIVRDGTIRGIIVENKAGTQAIRARVVIDCTGDGDIAAKAGAPVEIGRGRDDETQTQTLVFLLGNVNVPKLMPVRMDIPVFVKKARENSDYSVPYAGGAAIQPVVLGEHGVVNVNSINIPEVSGLKVEDLTYSHVEAQREALELVDFYRKYVPGCESCYLLSTAEYIGVRETRRIIGEYVLTGEDALAGATFEDGIARGFYPIDIHSPDRTGDAAGARLSRPYEIPYRCLVPKNVGNLLVAGRCISADHVAHGSLRVMGTTMPLGEAAGCAAALSIAENKPPRDLRGAIVRRTLERLNAIPKLGRYVTDNLAPAKNGTVATADSIYAKSGYIPDNAIDGLVTRNQMSRWLSDDGPGPHWLQLDFAGPTKVQSVRLYLYTQGMPADASEYVPRGFDVQIPVENGWRTVASVRDQRELEPVLKFEPVTVRTLRVLFTQSCPADDIVRLREIVVR